MRLVPTFGAAFLIALAAPSANSRQRRLPPDPARGWPR